MGMQRKGFEMCDFIVWQFGGDWTFFWCFGGLGWFDFFFLGWVFVVFFFSTKLPCLSSLWELTEWGFLLCCQKACGPWASALSFFHWPVDLHSVNGCQKRGEGDKAEHWCSIVLWDGTGSFSSYSFKGRGWEIAGLESTLTDSGV